VLDTVTGEALHLAAIAADWEVDDDRPPRLQQTSTGVGLKAEQVGSPIELGDGDAPELRVPLAAGRDLVGLRPEHVFPPTAAATLDSTYRTARD
jgi:hypothetical protein